MEPFLTRRASGIWCIVHKCSNGKRITTSTKTRDRGKAELVLAEYRRLPPSIETGRNERPARKTSRKLSKFVKEFIRHAEASLSEKTVRLYRDAFAALTGVLGDVSIESISIRDVDHYKAARVKKVKAITVNKELSTLKAAFNQAIKWDYLTKNPFTGVKKLRVPDKMPVYFTREEMGTLIQGIGEDWLRDIVIIAAATGMRMGEMLQLTWPHVDLQNRMVKIVNSESFRTKTGRYRVVPLNETAMTVLVRRKALHERHVFTLAGEPISQDWLTHKFKKTIRKLKLRDELHFHSLRHTFASWLVQDGVSLYQVGRLLGHSDSKTTEIYAHLQPETMHDVVSRLNL